MANPYGIEQVDIPGVLGFVGQQRQRRMQEITFNQQQERQARDDERQIKRDSALARVFQPKGGDPASQSPNATPAMPGAPQSGAPATLVDPSRLPPRTDGMQINPDALRELYAADPQTASQIQKLVYDADEQQLKKAQANGEAMATVAYRLKQLPAAERAGELQAWAPQLQQLGLSAEQLAQADLSDRGLDRYYATGRSLKDLVAESKPDIVGASPGEVFFDKNTGKETFRSPVPRIIVGADGRQYAVDTPSGGAQGGAQPPDGAISMLRQRPELAAQFDAKYGEGASSRVLGGASPSGSRTFP